MFGNWLKSFLLLLLPAIAGSAEHPAPGATIVHFAQLDDGIYRGSKPKNSADFRFLQSKRIKYIMDLNFLPIFSIREKRTAKKYNMTFLRIPMNASPISPSEHHVDDALCILRDPRFHPIYFHCELGRDRTSLVAALYDEYFRGVSHQDAWSEMKVWGYKDWFGIRGLKHYFNAHPASPASAHCSQ